MTRVKPASVPQCWRATSRAAAVHLPCPSEMQMESPGVTCRATASSRPICFVVIARSASGPAWRPLLGECSRAFFCVFAREDLRRDRGFDLVRLAHVGSEPAQNTLLG